jgi:hypothetical protein
MSLMERRRRVTIAILVCAILAALILTVPTAFSLNYQFLGRDVCQTRQTLAQGLYWTPLYVVDSPKNGSANATAYAPYEPIRWSTATNGEVVGMFTLDLWKLYAQTAVWVWGAGSSASCYPHQAVDLSRSGDAPANYGVNSTVILPVGSTSDANVPNTVNIANATGVVYPSVWFNATYPANQTYGAEICGPGLTETFTLTQTPLGLVEIPFRGPSGSEEPGVAILSGQTSYDYVLDTPGLWLIGWANGVNPFGTGLSFIYESSNCTAAG